MPAPKGKQFLGGGAPSNRHVLIESLAGEVELHALDVDRSRQPFIYHPAIRRDQVLGHRLKQFLQTVFDGQAGELVLRLVEEAELSPEEWKRIEDKIEARERGNPADGEPGAEEG